jgi:hypothetical protein
LLKENLGIKQSSLLFMNNPASSNQELRSVLYPTVGLPFVI